MDRRKLYFIIGGSIVGLIILVVFFMTLLSRPARPVPATLQFWGTFDDASLYQQQIRDYRKLHPNITIEYKVIPFPDYEKNLISAFAAGLGSFLSPCILPLIPGFLSYLASTSSRTAA